jgi:hypothetical protein
VLCGLARRHSRKAWLGAVFLTLEYSTLRSKHNAVKMKLKRRTKIIKQIVTQNSAKMLPLA